MTKVINRQIRDLTCATSSQLMNVKIIDRLETDNDLRFTLYPALRAN